jgi:hypothetical protein
MSDPVLDAYWRQAFTALTDNVASGGRALLPAGDWPELDVDAQFYRSTDVNIAICGFDAILIHKGMMPSFRQADIALCLREMAVVQANPVFAVFVHKPRNRRLFLPWHLLHLKVYADPARYRRREDRRGVFIHIPKTGGTSIWKRLSKSVRSTIYFTSNSTLAAFEGDLDAFQIVGGHIHAETLIEKDYRGPAFFVLRDPVDRVLSAMAHAMRPDENISAFDDGLNAMRDMDMSAFDTALDRIIVGEGNVQTRMLGERPGDNLHDPQVRQAMFARACERLHDPMWQFGFLDDPAKLAKQVSVLFGVSAAKLPHLNRTGRNGPQARAQQIHDAILLGDACMDLKLYEYARAIADGSTLPTSKFPTRR